MPYPHISQQSVRSQFRYSCHGPEEEGLCRPSEKRVRGASRQDLPLAHLEDHEGQGQGDGQVDEKGEEVEVDGVDGEAQLLQDHAAVADLWGARELEEGKR